MYDEKRLDSVKGASVRVFNCVVRTKEKREPTHPEQFHNR